MRTALVVGLVLLSGCFSPVEELGGSSSSSLSSTGPEAGSCQSLGAALRVRDAAEARRRLQGRWLRCGALRGDVREASPLARDLTAFELDGDRWFQLEQRAGAWQRLTDLDHAGQADFWAMGNTGVSFALPGGGDPAVTTFTDAGAVRLTFYPGADADYVPLR